MYNFGKTKLRELSHAAVVLTNTFNFLILSQKRKEKPKISRCKPDIKSNNNITMVKTNFLKPSVLTTLPAALLLPLKKNKLTGKQG